MFGADNKDRLGLGMCETPEGLLQGCLWEPYCRCLVRVYSVNIELSPCAHCQAALFSLRPGGWRLPEGEALGTLVDHCFKELGRFEIVYGELKTSD